MNLPMTASARSSMIAMCILWLLVATAVGFRIRGRFRGPGIGLDDCLSVAALVRQLLLSFSFPPSQEETAGNEFQN